MTNSSKYKYLAKNTLLFTISSFGSKILVLLLVPLYTSILTTTEYGIADIITTSAYLLMHVFTINIADSVLRFAIEQKEDQQRFLSYGLRILLSGSGILGLILLLSSAFHIIAWDNRCYVFLFFDYFAISLYQILSNYLRAIDKIKEVAISGVIITLVTILFNIVLLLWYRLGLVGYLVSIIAGSAVSSVYCLIVIRMSPIRILKDCCDSVSRKEMRSYSIPLIFNGVAWWMNNSLDKYFVIGMCGPSENGVLSIAYKLPTILSVFHTVFFQAWNLSAIREYDKNDSDGFFSKTYSLYNTGMVLVTSSLILINIPLARILFAKDFFAAWQYSSILLLSTLFSSLSTFVGSVFAAVKDSRIYAVSTVAAAVVNCILNYVLIHFFGTIGAAIATVVSFVFVWLIRLVYSRKYIKWRINIGRDILAYSFLVLQIVFEHLDGHFYVGQVFVLISLLLLYRQYIREVLQTGIRLFNKVKGN